MGLGTNVAPTQAGALYIAEANGFSKFSWAGRVSKMGTITNNAGGRSVSMRLNPRGGIERDRLNKDVEGTVDSTVTLKQALGDRLKTELMSGCLFHFDRRTHCTDGRDRDAPDAWTEITRVAFAAPTSREMPETTWDGEEDAIINIPISGLEEVDIYQVNAQLQATVIVGAASFVAADTAHADNCGGCGPAEECTIVAVSTLIVAGSPVLAINDKKGAPADWTIVTLTEWTTADASDVAALGNFVLIVSNGEGEALRSDDGGTTRVVVTNTDFAANGPNKISAADQNNILIAGDGGYVYRSDDGARSILTILDGNAAVTTQNLADIKHDPNNAQVAIACGASDALIKTDTGGDLWYSITAPTAGKDLLALYVQDEYSFLVIDEDGVIWETEDGGETWGQQTALASLPTGTETFADFDGFGYGVIYLTVTNGTASTLYRNVSNGAGGYWVAENTEAASMQPAVAACDANTAVSVGDGGSATTNAVVQVA